MKKVWVWILALLLAASLAVAETESFESATVGETVSFGRYEQGGGSAPIEWIVLDRLEDRVLLLSKNALDCQPFHGTEDWNVTWETCSLRNWMNTDFFTSALDEQEQARILPAENSDDRVFLLSMDEVSAYLPTEEARIAEATEYAVARGGRVSRSTGKTYWWLRTKAASEDCVLLVKYDGSIDAFGDSMEAAIYTVRPAMWVQISE